MEADVARLRKLLDDTNIIRMHLESDIESLKEELITLKKNHGNVRVYQCDHEKCSWRTIFLITTILSSTKQSTTLFLNLFAQDNLTNLYKEITP